MKKSHEFSRLREIRGFSFSGPNFGRISRCRVSGAWTGPYLKVTGRDFFHRYV